MSSPTSDSRNWFGRNWPWVVPTGCLTLLTLVVAFVVALVLLIFGTLKSSDIYRQSVSIAASSPEVQEVLGEPVEPGWFLMGSISWEGPSGDAELSIPISGPLGKGELFVSARRHLGKWHYDHLVVQVSESDQRIDIKPQEAQH